jgi:Tfp pilus assembly protein PilF
MTSNIPGKLQKSNKLRGIALGRSTVRWFVPVTVFAATCAAFLPILWNDFVDWDDYENLISNQYFRGLGWNQLGWMFTTFHMGPYQPLSWFTLGLDYSIWGMDPVGYHITNVLLHSANAVALYFVSRRLLTLALSESDGEDSWQVILSAAFAALCFALHPLRVESVAWATERRDVLSGLFYLWTIHCYLRARSRSNENVPSRHWMTAAFILYLLTLLSKATAITFPVVMVLLDICPLKRLTWNLGTWFVPEARNIWREKIPFIAVAVVFASIAVWGQHQVSAVKSLGSYGIEQRLAQVFFGASFYLWKTLVPVGLSPLYEIPSNFSLWDSTVLIAGLATVAVSVWLFLIRHRWPAGLVCWLYYLAVLAPVLGLVPTGPQLVADRYSYLSCMSLAVLAGGALLFFLRGSHQMPIGLPPVTAIGATAVAIIIGLACLTWRQTAYWRNTETLWTRALEIDPNSSFAHYNLARYIARSGRYDEAMRHYREALAIRPDDADSHNNLGLLLAANGELEKAVEHFDAAIRVDPNYAKAHFNLGRVFVRQGRVDEAVEQFQRALGREPGVAEIHENLARALALQGKKEQAAEQFEAALRILKSPQPTQQSTTESSR